MLRNERFKVFRKIFMKGIISFNDYVNKILNMYSFAPTIVADDNLSDTTTDIDGDTSEGNISDDDEQGEYDLPTFELPTRSLFNFNPFNRVTQRQNSESGSELEATTKVKCHLCKKEYSARELNRHLYTCRRKNQL